MSFDKNAAVVKKTMLAWEGKFKKGAKAPEDKSLLSAAAIRKNVLTDMKVAVKQLTAFRKGSQDRRCVDMSFEQYMKSKFGFGNVGSLYTALGIDPSYHTIENLSTMPDFEEGYRWLIPEVVRAAVRLGLRRNPIYPNLIAGEESVTQRQITMPHINMSDATPEIVNEAETIPVGSVSFGERTVNLKKIGTGLKVSDEVQKYVSLNILSLYLQDAGVKLGLGMDTMAIDTLLNGDDSPDTFSAPVIGVDNVANGIIYKDMLRAWLRMGNLGRMPSGMLSNEEAALKILLLDEFKKWSGNTNTAHKELNIRTPIPQSQDYYIHGAMPTTEKLALIDKSAAMLKLNATALSVESERIAERQLSGTYVTITTGYARLFRDAFVVIDGEIPYVGNEFPSFMDVHGAENVLLK